MRRPRAAYIHIPFCISKCWYCDFNSYPGLESIFGDYVRAVITEVERAGHGGHGGPPLREGNGGDGGPPLRSDDARSGRSPCRPMLDSVYFGGGTPTMLAAADLSAVLDAIRLHLGGVMSEVTVEANPGTVDLPKLRELRLAGFNRLSLGVQSFDDEFLRLAGRAHTRQQAMEAYESARGAGFGNVGIDLIFALPGQSIGQWSNALEAAIALQPEHISLYELSIEEGTRFAQLCAEGKLQPVDEDAQLAMYELAIERLTSAGYEHYEVSNFARPGYRSRHNMTYWLNEPYYGFGAGATSYVDGVRARRIADPRQYISAIESGSDAIESSETLDDRRRLGETIVQGLRMSDGVDLARVERETRLDPMIEFAPQLAALTERGLIEVAHGRLRVTHSGLLLLNDVSSEFV